MIIRDMLRARPFDMANYINEPDDVFAYLELLRDEDAGDPSAWNSALAVLLGSGPIEVRHAI